MAVSAAVTERPGLRPWHFFTLVSLVAASVGMILAGPQSVGGLVLLVLSIAGAGLGGLAVFRTLWPLAAVDFVESLERPGQWTRIALERQKTLVLRSIKELEFDRAMGKVADADFQEMAGRLRSRAIGLMKQLDAGSQGYGAVIERDLRTRLTGRGLERAEGRSATPSARTCASCQTSNDLDARFCKSCGGRLDQG